MPWGRAHRVLVVDDEEDFRVVLGRRLEASGFEVLQAEGGTEGLERARAEQPDLIVLDLMLPGLDGVQVYRALREEPTTSGIPVLFLTAVSAGLPMTEQSLDLLAQGKHGRRLPGPYAVMIKPYEPKELIGQIRRMLEPQQSQG